MICERFTDLLCQWRMNEIINWYSLRNKLVNEWKSFLFQNFVLCLFHFSSTILLPFLCFVLIAGHAFVCKRNQATKNEISISSNTNQLLKQTWNYERFKFRDDSHKWWFTIAKSAKRLVDYWINQWPT